MFGFRFTKNKNEIVDKVSQFNKTHDGVVLSKSFEENVALIQKLFADDDTLIVRQVGNSYDKRLCFCLFYNDSVADSKIINENIIKPLTLSKAIQKDQDLMDSLMNQVLQINELKKTNQVKEIVESVTYGDTILLIDGEAEALILNSKSFETRALEEPPAENVLSGPREGFCESIKVNLSLIRRRLRTNEFKIKFITLGQRTGTKVAICYIDDIVNKDILKEVHRRLEKIQIDGILDAHYITEMIEDSHTSPFRTIGYTERPDVVVAKILEGRIAILVDGTPVVLTIPYLFIENFQSNEDYYLNYYYTSFTRFVRILSFLLTITVPAIYIAIGAFQHQMFPTQLLINIASERAQVPLPAALEAFVMLVVFDILRETGIRIPSNVGQALSIVGALVIGQAAVQAKLVAAPMIIIVALTAITSLLIPKLNSPIIFIRLILLTFASVMGLVGLILGLAAMLIHILNLSSFGILQMTPVGRLQEQKIKDIVIRAPWNKMMKRPGRITQNPVRLGNVPQNNSQEDSP